MYVSKDLFALTPQNICVQYFKFSILSYCIYKVNHINYLNWCLTKLDFFKNMYQSRFKYWKFLNFIVSHPRTQCTKYELLYWSTCLLCIFCYAFSNFSLTIILLEPKVISLCHLYRARPACISVQSDQALYYLLTNFKFSSWYP